MSQPRVAARVWKRFAYPEPFRDHNPIFLQTFESTDEIRQHLAIGIDKPIKLVAMRGGMDARRTTVLNPADKLFESHFLPHLGRFISFIERNNAVPWIANEPKLKIARELLPPPFLSPLAREHGIKPFHDSVFSSSTDNPVAFHHSLDLGQAQVWLDRRPQNTTHAGGTGFGNFNEDALVAVRDHSLFNRQRAAQDRLGSE